MKKFLSVILSLLICFSSMSIVALAESSMDIIVDEVEVQYGATEATVNIKIPNNPGIALLGFNVDYDTSAMTLESATLGDIFTGDLDCNISAVPFVFNVYTGSSNKTSSGTLVTLKFNLKDKCPIGKYTIELKNVEALNIDENPVEYEVKNGYVNVKAKEMTGLSFEDKTYTYDATEKSLVVNGVPSGATVSYTSNDTTENRAKNVGTYTIYATVTKEGYNTWSKSAVLKINPKNLTVSGITVENKTYDGTTNATVKGGSLSGKVAGDDVDAIFPTTGTFANANVGKNVVVSIDNIVLNGNNKDNYTLTQPTGLKANITKAPISVKADDITIIQGATIPALTYTITSGQLFGADEITGSLATAAIGSDLGTFNITKGTLAVPSNYDLTFTKGTLTVVDKTPQNITVSDITEKTYGDSPFVVTATPDSTSQLAEFTFESSNTDVAEIATDGTVTIKAAGETDITVKQAGNEEFATFTKTQKLIVNKKAITIASINGDEKTAVLEGVLAEDTDVTLDYNKLNIEVAEAASETTSNVTFTNFVLIGNDATNYTITTESVSSVISNENMVTVTITADKGTATGAAKYIKGSSVTVSITPNTGYSFRGWYVNDTSVSTAKTYTFTADTDTVLVAKIVRRSSGGGGGSSYFTVKFDTNGGTTVSDQKIKGNTVVKVPEAPTNSGFTFEGWYTDKEFTKEYDFVTKVTKNMTLYAKWAEIDKTMSQIILTIGDKNAKVFGEDKTNDVSPIIVNDRTMLPARFVAENLGANVEWDETAPGIVTITKDDIKIEIYIGEEYAVVNGEKVKLDSPAFIENDRTYTPIRFISEKLSAEIEWLPETQQVVITK